MPDNDQNYPKHVAESSDYSNEYVRSNRVELGVKVETTRMWIAYKIQHDAKILISKLYQYGFRTDINTNTDFGNII